MKQSLTALLTLTLVLGSGCETVKKRSAKKVTQLPNKGAEVSPAVKQAREAFERREYEKVISLLEGGVTDKRASPEHFYFLAMAYMNVARLPECDDTLRIGAERFPGYHVIREGAAYYQYVIGRLRLEEGQLDEAHAAFGEALDQLKDDASFQTKVAGGYREGARRLIEQGRAKLAVKALEKARKRLPTEPTLAKALDEARAAAGGAAVAAKAGEAPTGEALKRIMAEPGSGAGAPAPVATAAAEELVDAPPTASLAPGTPVTPVSGGVMPPDQQGAVLPGGAKGSVPDSAGSPAPGATPGGLTGPLAAGQAAIAQPGAEVAAPVKDSAPPGTLEEAQRALDARDPARAASLARLVLASNPMDREALMILTRALDRQGKSRDAVTPLQVYLDAHPGDAKASLEMARVKAALNDAATAEKLADGLIAAPTTEPAERLGALHTKAIARLQSGNVKGAEESLTAALAQDPEYPPALFVKGQIEESRKKYKDAIAFFERAARPGTGDAESPRYNFRLGLLYRQTGQDEAAARTFQRVLAEDPNGPWGRKAKAFAADPAPAAAGAKPAAAPLTTPPRTATGPTATAAARPEVKPATPAPAVSLDAYAQTVEANPGDVSARLAYGDALEKSRKAGEALAQFEKAAELAPAREDVHVRVGTARFQTKDLPGATAAFKQAMQLNPKNPRTYFYLGDLLAMQKDTEGQRQVFQQLLDQNINEKTNTQAKQMLRRLDAAPGAKKAN